jgi:hypothetical protein
MASKRVYVQKSRTVQQPLKTPINGRSRDLWPVTLERL